MGLQLRLLVIKRLPIHLDGFANYVHVGERIRMMGVRQGRKRFEPLSLEEGGSLGCGLTYFPLLSSSLRPCSDLSQRIALDTEVSCCACSILPPQMRF